MKTIEKVELTLKNYKCFSESKPVKIGIKSGFTALIGMNNSGKSSLLKFFYEFRQIWNQLSTKLKKFQNNNDQDFLEFRTHLLGLTTTTSLNEINGFSHHGNERPLSVEFKLFYKNKSSESIENTIYPDRFTILVENDEGNSIKCKLKLYLGKQEIIIKQLDENNKFCKIEGETRRMDLSAILECMSVLSQCRYFGAHRHSTPIGGGDYYDLKTGSTLIKHWGYYKSAPKQKDSLLGCYL